MTKVLLTFLAVFTVVKIFADDEPTCPNIPFVRYNNVSLQQLKTSKGCLLQVRPHNTSDTYRNFLFTSNGHMLIFNSHGKGPTSQNTSAREYLFFPRQHQLTFSVEDDILSIQLVNGEKIQFDTITTHPLNFTNTSWTETDKISTKNNGGFEIHKTNGIYIDLGYRIGGSPTEKPNNPIIIRDDTGGFCKLKIKDFYRYSKGEPYFQFLDDHSLANYLNKACPSINTTSLYVENK